MNQFAERNARHFHPKVSVSVSLIVDPDFHEKLKVEVGFTHKSNFHDRETYSMRHNKSVLALKDALMDVQLNASFSV